MVVVGVLMSVVTALIPLSRVKPFRIVKNTTEDILQSLMSMVGELKRILTRYILCLRLRWWRFSHE